MFWRKKKAVAKPGPVKPDPIIVKPKPDPGVTPAVADNVRPLTGRITRAKGTHKATIDES